MSKPTITEGLVPGTHPPIGTRMWQRNYGMGARVQILTVVRHTPTRFICTFEDRNVEYAFQVRNWGEVGGERHYALGRIQPVVESDPVYQQCLIEDKCQSLWSKLSAVFERRAKLNAKNLERLEQIWVIAQGIER